MDNVRPFDVITCHYRALNGSDTMGLFLVVHVDGTNLLCAKMTSQFDSRYLGYSVLVLQRTNPFLQTDSYIQMDKLHTLSSNDCYILGRLAPVARRPVKDVLNRFHYDVLSELNEHIKNRYVSPNVIKRYDE